MRKVRVVAAMLAILTALIDALFCLSPIMASGVLLLTAAGAVCLAVVVPFDAREPPARKRVVAACVFFVAAIGAAVWQAQQSDTDRAVIAALMGLLVGGIVLSIWAFAVRNRRRRPGWAGYYDF